MGRRRATLRSPTARVACLSGALFCAASMGCDLVPSAERRATGPTFTRDVAPILFQRCAPCHRPGEVAPFSLLTYRDARSRAREIADATRSRYMPPWLPEPGHGEFAGQRRLSDRELGVIQEWVRAGAPEGDPTDLPPAPRWTASWQLGQPDLIVRMAEPYALAAHEGHDVFRNFVMPIPLSQTRFVRAVEFRPGNARLVHHAVMKLDRTRATRVLDRDDPEPGYGGMILREGESPEGHFLGWSPGKVPLVERPKRDALAWRLDPGTDLILQLHLQPTDRSQTIQSAVGLFFSSTPPSRTPFGLQLGSYTIDIPPGEKNYAVEDTYVLPVDVDLHGVYPHAHYLGREMQAFATLPGGSKKWLILIKNWDFNWQDEYRYASPVFLPRGSTLVMRYTYDNSADNAQNPHQPPRRVVYGGQSSDEMGNLWMQVVPRSARDLAALKEDFERKAATRYIAGYRKMLAEKGEQPSIHRALAASYLRIGRLDEAIVHAESALRAEPGDAHTHYNLGLAYAGRREPARAAAHFRKAIDARPDYAEAHNNLGVMLQSLGKPQAAIASYRQALAIAPDYPEAHNNLGVMLQAGGQIEEAIRHFRRAVELEPDYALARSNLDTALKGRGRR